MLRKISYIDLVTEHDTWRKRIKGTFFSIDVEASSLEISQP